ncbi:ABC transporter permease subunit [Saccharibacillus sp. CPCC 101409]|uniref:ABC transporter permease subunit n=1 Tax=Saccharibacillus sp. CPCC 101409 TaxID=3058041 RepID=UPI002673BC41|nr:ABC transporter permease subunit [Saccharibacillus sp. CPCC 101409]MDO3408722.1 ABC transporter permease subunit [Saccharibacillus sp. CPCC 101409]
MSIIALDERSPPILLKSMFRSFLIALSVFVVVALVVLIPRDFTVSVTPQYWIVPDGSLNWQAYGENIRGYVHSAIEHRTLGVTRYGEPAEPVVWAAFKISLPVILGALLAGFVLGIPKGMLDYALSRTRFALLGGGTTWLMQALPDFFLLLLARWYVIHYQGSHIRFFAQTGWESFVIPTVLASIYPIFYVARVTSSSIAGQEGLMYVKTARAKGMPESIVFGRHIMSNSLARVFTHIMPLGVYILSSLLLIEYLRNVPGASYRAFQAIDYNKVTASGGNVEPGVLIGTAFCFMLLVLVFQAVGYLARRRVSAR